MCQWRIVLTINMATLSRGCKPENYPVQTRVSEMYILPLDTPVFPNNRVVDCLTDLPSASVTRFGSVSAALMNVNSPIIPN